MAAKATISMVACVVVVRVVGFKWWLGGSGIDGAIDGGVAEMEVQMVRGE